MNLRLFVCPLVDLAVLKLANDMPFPRHYVLLLPCPWYLGLETAYGVEVQSGNGQRARGKGSRQV
jgi:hypothetical protein